MSLYIRDKLGDNGRIFVKSEWNQIDDDWPCLSYSKPSVGDFLRREFDSKRDILIYVGISDENLLVKKEFKRALISAIKVEPNLVVSSKEIVSPKVWEESHNRFGEDKWIYAIPVTWSANIIGPPFPSASKFIKETYSSFSNLKNWGQVVEISEEEMHAVQNIEIEEFSLNLTDRVQNYLDLKKSTSNEIPKNIREEATRMAELIQTRVNSSGHTSSRNYPTRTSPNLSDLNNLIVKKLIKQLKKCALCGGPLKINTNNPMLQPSPDRIDSDNISYEDSNLQITHLACNLAKNNNCDEKFKDWLKMIRNVS